MPLSEFLPGCRLQRPLEERLCWKKGEHRIIFDKVITPQDPQREDGVKMKNIFPTTESFRTEKTSKIIKSN